MTRQEFIEVINGVKNSIRSNKCKEDFDTLVKLFFPSAIGGVSSDNDVIKCINILSWKEIKENIKGYQLYSIINVEGDPRFAVITRIDKSNNMQALHVLLEDGTTSIWNISILGNFDKNIKVVSTGCRSLPEAVQYMTDLKYARQQELFGADDEHVCCGNCSECTDITDKSHCGN